MAAKKKVATTGKVAKDNSNAKSRLAELSMPATLMVKIGEQTLLATAKEFSTGSIGYYANGKIQVGEDGYPCQVGVNIIAVRTK